jgi:hypothetical protein
MFIRFAAYNRQIPFVLPAYAGAGVLMKYPA